MPPKLKKRAQKRARSEETLRAILTRKGGPMQNRRDRRKGDARRQREPFEGYAEGYQPTGSGDDSLKLVDYEALVPLFRLDKLTDRLRRLERTAKRAGLPLTITIADQEQPLEMTFLHHYTDRYGNAKEREEVSVVPARRVTMRGIAMPQMRGWTFVARLTPTPDFKENIISNIVPDLKVPVVYHKYTGACDQCGLKRDRNDTFVLQSDKGEWKQVGRNCLADFLQTNKIDALIDSAALLEEVTVAATVAGMDSEFEGGGRGRSPYFQTEPVLAAVAWAALKYGYKPKSAEGTPTSVQTMHLLERPDEHSSAQHRVQYLGAAVHQISRQ